MRTLPRVPDRESEPDPEPSGSGVVRRALSWPVRLALGFLFSVALWATLTAVAQAAGSAEQPVPPADAGTTTDTSQPPADDGGTPAENPADPAAPPADGTTAGTPEQAPPADDGSVPPQDVPPAGAETTPPPADGAPSEQPPSTDPNASGGNGQGVGCALPANSGEGSACPASSPNEPQSVPAQPSDSAPPDTAEPSPPVADPAPLPPAEPVSEPAAETPPAPVAEPVTEPVAEAPVEPSADDAVVEEALEEDVVAETAGTCDASSVGVDLTTIVDLTAPALPCGDDLPVVVADDAADDPDVCGVVVPVISSGGTLDAIGAVPVSALSEAAATHADGPVPTPTVSAVSSNAHQPFHRQGPGAPAPMPAAPPAPAATGSGGACGGAGMRRDGIDRAGDQVAVLVRTDDLGVPTAAEQAATSAPADAVLARELDPRFRPD